ncbi:MAG: GlsB/YeaQ/YmgE family stress response membrane protein [Thermoleophilia bacterium]
MSLIAFLIVGLIAGWLAGLIMRGHGLGILGDVIVGVIGAFIGGFVFSLLGVATGGWLGWILTALVGAVILLFIVNLFTGYSGRRAIHH